MSKLIALCDGHGMETAGKRTPLIGELGRVIHENEFNRAVVNILDSELKRCGFRTLLVAPTDKDASLEERVNLANRNKADAYVSVHYNAFDGRFDGRDPEGHSIHIFPGSREGLRLAKSVHKHLRMGTVQVDRGIKEDRFYVLKNTTMPAILSENGFMDNKREALLMLNKDFQKEVAVEHAKGLCDYFGVKYVEEPKPQSKPVAKSKVEENVFYRVVTGSFSDRDNAEKRIADLKSKGFESFIDVIRK